MSPGSTSRQLCYQQITLTLSLSSSTYKTGQPQEQHVLGDQLNTLRLQNT